MVQINRWGQSNASHYTERCDDIKRVIGSGESISKAADSIGIPPGVLWYYKRRLKANPQWKPLPDLTGQKFNDLTVTGLRSAGVGGQKWNCQCACGGKKIVTTANLRFGEIKSCGCRHFRVGKNNPRFRGIGDISFAFWKEIKRGSEVRGIQFGISIEFGWALFQKQGGKCALSGVPIQFDGKKMRNASLDRIDSGGAYSEDNVQWVHKDVNRLKNNFPEPEFLWWIGKIDGFQHERTGPEGAEA